MFSVVSVAVLIVLTTFTAPPLLDVSPSDEGQVQCLAPATYDAETGTVSDPCGAQSQEAGTTP